MNEANTITYYLTRTTNLRHVRNLHLSVQSMLTTVVHPGLDERERKRDWFDAQPMLTRKPRLLLSLHDRTGILPAHTLRHLYAQPFSIRCENSFRNHCRTVVSTNDAINSDSEGQM